MPVMVVLLCIFGVVVFIQMGALIELFEQIKQIRRYLDLEDQATPLELGAIKGTLPSEIGLPHELNEAAHSVVAFLSNRCGTCHAIASYFEGGATPKALWLVVVPVTGDGQDFMESYRLYGDRVLVDRDQQIVGRIGLELSPAALVVRDGRIESAQTVPTIRQLYELLPTNDKRGRLPVRLGTEPRKAQIPSGVA